MRLLKIATSVTLCVAGAAAGAACRAEEPPIVFETIEQDCDHKCSVAVDKCAYNPTADQHEGCVEECLERMEESQEIGPACAQSYEDLMVCIATLETCDELADWALRKPHGSCIEVTREFDQKCEELR